MLSHIDNYDAWPPSLTREQFLARANDVGGTCWRYDFAVSHGKPFGAGEWGVASGVGQNGGGDNPSFIQWMWEFFQDKAGENLRYEACFNTCEPNNVGSNIYLPPGPNCVFQNPASAQRYLSLWGGTTWPSAAADGLG